MLLEARAAAGPDRFDALLREYVADNAHRIATPDDVRRAFAPEPEVVEILESYGALR
jgi:aminopeptidase N